MSLAVHAEPGRDFLSAPASSAPSKKKLFVASVAITGATAMAVTPMVSNAPALEAAQQQAAQAVQQRAVELAAFENPLLVLNETFSKAWGHLNNRGGEISATLVPNLSTLLGNQQLQRELATALFNPFSTIPAILNNLGEHRETLITGIRESSAGGAAHNAKLPGVIQKSLTELSRGQFTESFAHLNDWFIFGLGESGWPLYPVLEIPGEVARAIGSPAIGAVLDAMFVGDTTLAGYPHAILVPYVSAIFRFTDSLDEIRASIVAGDLTSALSHVVNLPAKVVGAFLNGYRPTIAPEWSTFPGLLSEGGTIDGFFVQYPKLFADALRNLRAPQSALTVESELGRVASPAVVAEADTVTLSLGTGSGSATPVSPIATGGADEATEDAVTDADGEAGAEVPVADEPVVDEPVVDETGTDETGTDETVADETVADEVTEDADTDTKADDTKADDEAADDKAADDKAADESDSTADDKADEKADDKAEGKAGLDSDAKADDKADAKAAERADRKAAKADRGSDSSAGSDSSSGDSKSSSGSSGSDSE